MPPNDPNSYPGFDMAARLYFYGDEFSSAREMMERAAGVATATGDIVTAAYRHVDAAFIAVWEGYPGSRREHVRQAESFASRTNFERAHAARIYALINGVTALPAQFHLGRIYEKLDEPEKAREHYRIFVEWWQTADPELQPWVDEGRAALERLDGRRGTDTQSDG
jgi:hypothetical protein